MPRLISSVSRFSPKIPIWLRQGRVGILPTDTVYGISASVLDSRAIERVYRIKKRDSRKRCIVLIASLKQLSLFGIRPSQKELDLFSRVWPGRVTIAFKVQKKFFPYLHKGTGSLAFRVPARRDLRRLLQKTGPLISTSANLSGKPVVRSVKEAISLFGDNLDFYVDKGNLLGAASTLIVQEGKGFRVLRQGSGRIPRDLISS